MKKTFITLSCLLLTAHILFAQHSKIITSGRIEFVKRINMHGMYRQELGSKMTPQQQTSYDNYVRSFPQQFAELKSTLVFSQNKSLFTPIEPDLPPTIRNMGGNPMAKQFNTVYTDLTNSSTTALKHVYDATYLVKDSTRKITWRITGETAEIAGYTCRRANGLMMDSVYIVAFFTDKIWYSGGPESFSGLPGMILQLALPHENVIWIASKVTDEAILPETIVAPVAPKKVKTVTNKQLKEEMTPTMKQWGQAGPYEMKIFLL
jgi:GLPGLI family protein